MSIFYDLPKVLLSNFGLEGPRVDYIAEEVVDDATMEVVNVAMEVVDTTEVVDDATEEGCDNFAHDFMSIDEPSKEVD